MKTAVRILALALVFAIGTRAIGWWAVPVIGLAWGIVARRDGWAAGVGALVAWGALLGRDALLGPVGELATTLGAIFHAPAALLVALTLAFPLALAWSAATVGAGLRALRAPRATARRSRT